MILDHSSIMDITNVEDHHNFLFFIERYRTSCILVKYDIFTKHKHILFKEHYISNYYIHDTNLVITFVNKVGNCFLYWHKGDKSKKISCLKCRSNRINPIVVDDKLYIVFKPFQNAHVYGFNEFYKIELSYLFLTSRDGRFMVRSFKFPKICLIDINNLNILYDRYENNTKYSLLIDGVNWMYSNFLICFEKQGKWIFKNLNTKKTCIMECFNRNIFVLGNILLIIHKTDQKCSLYDVEMMNLLDIIQLNILVIGVNNLFNILITDDFQYYRISKDYCLKKAVIKQNYTIDHKYTFNKINIIMDIILDIIDLPLELLNIELYRYVILFC